jgi:succinate dehydrogenase / fumarate reductase, cytochrome b subunit
MSILRNLFTSSIGRKFLMAVTGLVLVGFVTGHLIGNLQVFSAPDKLNGYAHFLQSLGPTLWVLRLFLLACVAIHLWTGIALALENRKARGAQAYGAKRYLRASLSSRTMHLTGLVVLAFLVYHLAHFTIGLAGADSFKSALPDYTMAGEYHLMGLPVVAAGLAVPDVYSMVFIGFANPLVSAFYIVAIGLLTYHLWHGADSMFQSLGLRNGQWATGLRRLVAIYCIAYFLGNLAIPGAILSGVLQPATGTHAAEKLRAPAATPVVHR